MTTKNEVIRSERRRRDYTYAYMGSRLGISANAYSKKEQGKARFTDDEKFLVKDILEFSWSDFNSIFFESRLPIG